MRDFDYSELQAQLAKKPTIVITTHRGPDGDAMGSSLALYQVLLAQNYAVKVIVPNSYPNFLHWLPSNKPFLEINENDMERVYNVNVFSVFKIIQGLLPYLSDEAHVLNISSVGGLQGSVKFPGLSAYSSSKAALIALTECLAEEYKSTKWSFNCLALGAVQTEMLEEAFPGYKSSTSAKEMANYIRQFSIEGSRLFNGKILNVSKSTP
ncbi:SDR family NAD(P)-dependent oxidoreductase [bacterium]|nr:SDR family NAD(P)-dependent oxidoreductase [bacterium]